MQVTPWGVRGSVPVPGRQTLEFGGNTTCYSVELGSHRILFDAGTGIRNSGGADWSVSLLFFSHLHHDHQQGLPFFPWIYMHDRAVHLYAPARMKRSLKDILESEVFNIPVFPAYLSDTKGRLHFDEVRTVDSIRLLDVTNKRAARTAAGASAWEELEYYYPKIENFHIKTQISEPPLAHEVGRIDMCDNYAHPMNGTFFYRVTDHRDGKKLVYATDTEPYLGGNQALIRFAAGADILIHDAQYTVEQYRSSGFVVQGFGHSDWRSAVDVAVSAQVRILLLTHFDPANNDEVVRQVEADAQAYARERAPELVVIAAREGTPIDV